MEEETPSAGADPGSGLPERAHAQGLLRLAAGAWLRTGLWTAGTAYKAGRRLARAAVSGESAVSLIYEARDEAVGIARRALGLPEHEPEPDSGRDEGREPLRRRWEDLMERSSEVVSDEDLHPAFADILEHLHPDEARILRVLAREGPQAAVDVRNWRPLGIGSRVVAPGLTMVAKHAGCLHPDRVHAYLANLFRLGLIWFSRDPVPEISPYQVLEAQPEVSEAMRRAGRGTTVRRSIRLTPFGKQFCLACLPEGTGEFEALVAEPQGPDAVPPPLGEEDGDAERGAPAP